MSRPPLGIVVAALVAARAVGAQVDTVRLPSPVAAAADSIRPPLSPRRAFIYGMLVPGAAQTILQRPRAAALFIGMEALSITMARKSANDLRQAKRSARDSIVAAYRIDPATGLPVLDDDGNLIPESFLPNPFGADRVAARRTHYEDWIAALIFNHLISGAEAFVSAHLWDLPAQVEVSARAFPGGVMLGATIPW